MYIYTQTAITIQLQYVTINYMSTAPNRCLCNPSIASMSLSANLDFCARRHTVSTALKVNRSSDAWAMVGPPGRLLLFSAG